MSVLNPFFRQQIQNPGGISTTPDPVVDTWSDDLKIKNALIDEQLKAVDLSINAYGSYVEAKAQIKEEENKQILKNVANDIAQDAITMVQGYKNQEDFKIGEYEVNKGKKGFHAYSDFEGQVKGIKADILRRLEETHNPNGEDKLRKLIETAVEGSFIDPVAQSDEIIRKHIHDRSLADLRELSITTIEAFSSRDYSAVVAYDNSVDQKVKDGTLSDLEGEKEKIAWRKDAFQKMIYEKLPANATLEERRSYLQWFQNVLEYKKQKDSSKLNAPEKEFYEKLSILDIYELNRGLGGTAFTTPKEDQLSTLTLMGMEKPLQIANMFGYRIEIIPNKEGKPTLTRIIPIDSVKTKRTFSKKEGYLIDFIKENSENIAGDTEAEKVERLASMQSIEEVGNKIREYYDNDIWPEGLEFEFYETKGKESRIEKIENVLNKFGFFNLSHADVIKLLKSSSSELLRESRASYGKGHYEEGKSLIRADVSQFLEEWSLSLNGKDSYSLHGFGFPNEVRPPVLPKIRHDKSFLQWDSIDPKVQKVDSNLMTANDLMDKSKLLLNQIKEGNVNITQWDETIKEIEIDLETLQLRADDEFNIGISLRNILNRALFAPYDKFKKTWYSRDRKDNRINWCNVKVRDKWKSVEGVTEEQIQVEAIRCSDQKGIRKFGDINK